MQVPKFFGTGKQFGVNDPMMFKFLAGIEQKGSAQRGQRHGAAMPGFDARDDLFGRVGLGDPSDVARGDYAVGGELAVKFKPYHCLAVVLSGKPTAPVPVFPTVAQSWRRHWEQVIPFFAFAPEVRKMIYTTNAIESLHSQVRKSIRNKGHFPSDEAATKLIWLALRYITAKWKNPPIAWHQAKAQFAIQFGERFTLND